LIRACADCSLGQHRVALEGEMDTDGLLGRPTDKRVGFSAITARVGIDADLSAAEKAQLVHDIDERCPISENLQNATPVRVILAPMSSPHRSRAISVVCNALDKTETGFPGTNLRLRYSVIQPPIS
jgi:hypothetical protein